MAAVRKMNLFLRIKGSRQSVLKIVVEVFLQFLLIEAVFVATKHVQPARQMRVLALVVHLGSSSTQQFVFYDVQMVTMVTQIVESV